MPRVSVLPKIARVAEVGGAVASIITLYEKGRKAQGKYRQRQWYVVDVADTEPIWLDLQERILGLIPSEDQRSLGVVYQRSHRDNPVALTSSRRTRRSLQFDCPTTTARDAVIAWIAEAADARRNRQNPPEFHIATRWGGWETMPPDGTARA